MSNHFFRITSDGGYFGSIYWANTDFVEPDPNVGQGWGRIYLFSLPSHIRNSRWPGDYWVVRAWLDARISKAE